MRPNLGIFLLRHFIRRMTNVFTPKSAKKFSCKECDFECSKRSDWSRHISTQKHKIRTNTNDFTPKNAKYICECGKLYKARNSLWYHKKRCYAANPEIMVTADDIDYKKLLLKALEKLNEQQDDSKRNHELMSQMIDKIGSTTNNTYNDHSSNTNNLNINMFLNEQCKNAVNLSDFIENIVISHADLENNARLGFVDGMTKIFTDNLKQMTLYERPIHCTDTKRDTLYIKDENTWSKNHSKE